MLTPIPQPIFVHYFSLFAPWCHSVVKDGSCLSTVGNDGYKCSVSTNTILSKRRHSFVTKSSNGPTQDSKSSDNKSVTCFDFVLTVDNDAKIVYERISSESGMAEVLVVVS